MKVFVITCAHMEPEIIGFSLAKMLRTARLEKYPDKWLLVDHHWPIDRQNFSFCVERFALMVGATVVRPEKNLGGHGGVSFALKHLKPLDDDLVLIYDPDSNPVTPGWGKAMVDVMAAEPKLGYLSLMPKWCITHRPWEIKEIAGKKCAFHPHPEMVNVTIFRGKVLRDGLLGNTKFYGNIETAMQDKITKLGLERAYLYDFLEEPCPIHHPQIYVDWKIQHGAGLYKGNFDQWCKERGL